jgi:hypothetical protein
VLCDCFFVAMTKRKRTVRDWAEASRGQTVSLALLNRRFGAWVGHFFSVETELQLKTVEEVLFIQQHVQC